MKTADKTKLAVDEASKGVYKVLGPNPDRDQLAEVALCIAHSVITQNGSLDLKTSMANTKLFCSCLIEITGNSQQGKSATTTIGKLM